MLFHHWITAAFATCTSAITLPSIDKRQANSAIAATAFRRRGYAAAATLNGWAYIDGGEFSYSSGGNTIRQYSNNLVAIDLSKDFSNGSISLQTISKPSGVPDVVQGNIWVDEAGKQIYIGASGRASSFGDRAFQAQGLWSFKPDGSGSGTWTNLNSSADAGFTNRPRPFGANYASGGGAGYVIGGFARNFSNSDPGAQDIPLKGLLTYNYTTQKLTNTTVTGTAMGGYNEMGGMVYSSNFGSKGILVSIGGDQVGKVSKGTDALLDMSVVSIYDIGNQTWYDQKTTGNIPGNRKEFCTAGIASNNKTFDILVYAGWDGHLGSSAVPYDEAYILSLPAFQWFKASYPAANPRHGVVCTAIGGGQILTVGGVDTTIEGPNNLYNDVYNSQDPFGQGFGIFDMNAMAFTTSYSAKAPAYTGAAAIKSYYSSNPRTPTLNSSLANVFAVQSFATSANTNSSSGSSGDSSSDKSSGSSAGAIAGGVVGGVVGLALILGLAWFFLRKRKQHQQVAQDDPESSTMAGAPTAGAVAHEADTSGHHEMDSTPSYKQGGFVGGEYYSADPKVAPASELPSELGTNAGPQHATAAPSELPSEAGPNTSTRHELA